MFIFDVTLQGSRSQSDSKRKKVKVDNKESVLETIASKFQLGSWSSWTLKYYDKKYKAWFDFDESDGVSDLPDGGQLMVTLKADESEVRRPLLTLPSIDSQNHIMLRETSINSSLGYVSGEPDDDDSSLYENAIMPPDGVRRLDSAGSRIQQAIQLNHHLLKRSMTPSGELLNELRSIDAVDRICSSKEPLENKNEQLLDVLRSIPPAQQELVYETFKAALRKSGQDHVANVLEDPPDTTVWPMSDEHWRQLTGNYSSLVRFLNPDSILDELLVGDVLSYQEFGEIRDIKESGERSRKILDKLLRKADPAFDRFVEILRGNRHGHVAYLLTGEGDPPLTADNHKLLTRNRSELFKFIDPENGLLDMLQDDGSFADTEVESIKECRTFHDKSRKFVEAMTRKSDKTFQNFMTYLPACGQAHVAFIITGDGVERPLEGKRRDRLTMRRNILVKSIVTTASSLIDELVSSGVLTELDKQRLQAEPRHDDKNGVLLDLIARKSDSAYDRFIDALCLSSHEHVAYELGERRMCIQLEPGYGHSGQNSQTTESLLGVIDSELKRGSVGDWLGDDGVEINNVYRGSIFVMFRYTDTGSLENLRRRLQTGVLDDAFTRRFCPSFARSGLVSLRFKFTDAEFERHGRLDLMTPEHQEALRNAGELLREKLAVTGELLKKLSLCKRRVEAIESAETDEERTRVLMDIVSRQPDCAFEQFINALRETGQSEVADQVEGHARNLTRRHTKITGSSMEHGETAAGILSWQHRRLSGADRISPKQSRDTISPGIPQRRSATPSSGRNILRNDDFAKKTDDYINSKSVLYAVEPCFDNVELPVISTPQQNFLIIPSADDRYAAGEILATPTESYGNSLTSFKEIKVVTSWRYSNKNANSQTCWTVSCKDNYRRSALDVSKIHRSTVVGDRKSLNSDYGNIRTGLALNGEQTTIGIRDIKRLPYGYKDAKLQISAASRKLNDIWNNDILNSKQGFRENHF